MGTLGAKIDWLGLARNLAAHLLTIRDVDVARRVLDDAAKDAAALDPPADWWELVTREFGAGSGSGDEVRRIRELILSKGQEMEKRRAPDGNA